jgi:hypothetical protein
LPSDNCAKITRRKKGKKSALRSSLSLDNWGPHTGSADMYGSPQPLDRIGIKRRVHAHNGTLFRDSLCNDQPIEGITMMKGERGQNGQMGDLDVQDLDAAETQLLGNEHTKRLSQSEPTKTELNSHLPQTGGAEPFVVHVIFN